MKSIDLKMTSVEVKTGPLRVKWTREMATDYKVCMVWTMFPK